MNVNNCCWKYFSHFGILSYVQALSGGQLHHGHFEMMRIGINKRMDESRMFAVWRIPAPWKPKTRKGAGRKMGGGKGSVNHYVTPVKAGRIIFELGGECEFEEVYMMLVSCGFYICNKVTKRLLFKNYKQGAYISWKVVENQPNGCHIFGPCIGFWLLYIITV